MYRRYGEETGIVLRMPFLIHGAIHVHMEQVNESPPHAVATSNPFHPSNVSRQAFSYCSIPALYVNHSAFLPGILAPVHQDGVSEKSVCSFMALISVFHSSSAERVGSIDLAF